MSQLNVYQELLMSFFGGALALFIWAFIKLIVIRIKEARCKN